MKHQHAPKLQDRDPLDQSQSRGYQDKDAALELTPSQELALRMVDTYQKNAQNERADFGEHARRTGDMAHVFARHDLPSQAIDAAYIHDLYGRSVGDDIDQSAIASMCLGEYFNGIDEEDALYIISLVNDMIEIEDIATTYRGKERLEGELGEDNSELWTREAPEIPLDEMLQLAQDVNIESVILKSCEMLDNLHNPPEADVSAVHDVYEAESFYAPLCEVLGYDGLAMELRSHAAQNRLIRQGKQDQMIPVARFLYEMRQLGPQSVLGKLADDTDDYDVLHVIEKPRYIEKYSDTSYESIQLGEFSLQVDERIMAGNWRIKSAGSLLKKLSRNVEHASLDDQVEVPMDIMGMTVISADTDTVAKDFKAVAHRVNETEGLIPQKAPSKTHPFVVQGDRGYIDRVCAELGEEFVANNVNIIENDKGYRVSKFTCLGEDAMPIEMQFVTKADRESARVGEWAHIFYKLKESGVTYTPEEKSVYAGRLKKDIHQRKAHLHDHPDRIVTNPRSAMRGRRAMMSLRRFCAIQQRQLQEDTP